MVLRITNNVQDYDDTTHCITLSQFGQKSYHPYIASKVWDKVYIDCTDETPRGFIKQLLKRSKVIPVFDVKNLTQRSIQILCEIVPDQSAALRIAFTKRDGSLEKLLEELRHTYWKE